MTKKDSDLPKKISETLDNYYNETILKRFKAGFNLFYTGKFRKKRVPRYLKIRIPVIKNHFCEDTNEGGFLITTKEITLFKIGTKVIKVPVRRKFKKGETIKFRRYSMPKSIVKLKKKGKL